MTDVHAIVYAYHSSPRLGELTRTRTNASLPFAGRYRLIDFALSSLSNAGVRDVGVIMQRDYQSLLDHLGSGKAWDLSRRRGGMRLLPPFGNSRGDYSGTAEALNAVISYVRDIPQEHVILMPADILCNIDVAAAVNRHVQSGCGVTAVCTRRTPNGTHYRFTTDDTGRVRQILFRQVGAGPGVAALEIYIVRKAVLLEILDRCERENRFHFHRDGIAAYLEERGGTMDVTMHDGYFARIDAVEDYFAASMDMLLPGPRASLFPTDRPVRTKERADVSTYYGEHARVENSLVADGCIIEGTVKNCVLFRGVRVAPGAMLENCILMQDTVICEGAALKFIISDKDVRVSPYVTLTGSEKLPLVIPKGSEL